MLLSMRSPESDITACKWGRVLVLFQVTFSLVLPSSLITLLVYNLRQDQYTGKLISDCASAIPQLHVITEFISVAMRGLSIHVLPRFALVTLENSYPVCQRLFFLRDWERDPGPSRASEAEKKTILFFFSSRRFAPRWHGSLSQSREKNNLWYPG